MKAAITTPQVFALSGLSICCILAIALGWEYALEPIVDRTLDLPHFDDMLPGLRLQFVTQATVFAALGMLPSIYISLRMARALRHALCTEMKARRAAEHAAETKMRFLANMSHELRTPLNAIIGFSELAQKNSGAGKCQEYTHIVHEAGCHLLAVVNDVLDLAKSDSDNLKLAPRTIDLDLLLRETVRTFSAQADKAGVSLDLVSPPATLPVCAWADEQRTRQAIFNLVSNAIKFTPANGHVRIAGEQQGTHAVITVCDNGIGIAPEEIERMFHPFEQADNSLARKFGGTGLGLPLARRFARIMGGELTLTSTPGEGTCAVLTLPTPTDTALVASFAA